MRDLQAEWMAAMQRGDYAAAWAVNDSVLRGRDPATRDDPGLPYHLRWVWDGRPFAGRHTLVRCYHGLGDTLLFLRYLAPLRAQAASVTLEVQPELLSLVQCVPGPDRIILFVPDAPAAPAECDIEIMELAHALRLPPESVPAPCLPIRPDPQARGAIGLCWAVGGWDQTRSIPPALLMPLAEGRRVVALHLGACETIPVLNPDGCPADLAQTASLVAGLDLVITVDAMIAHLAGMLRRPTWLLLKHDADWRWMRERDDSPWYPYIRIYRQPAPGAWMPVLERVAEDLLAFQGGTFTDKTVALSA